jgi:hypothetical protein
MNSVDSPFSASSPVPALAPGLLLSQSATGALRCALQARLRSPLPPDQADAALRHALRLVCAEAHRRALRPEQLIVALKQAWATVPEAQQLPLGSRRVALDHVVTLSIEEFYAGSGPARDTPDH